MERVEDFGLNEIHAGSLVRVVWKQMSWMVDEMLFARGVVLGNLSRLIGVRIERKGAFGVSHHRDQVLGTT